MPPQIILLFSGKRKCGKDFLTDQLKLMLGDDCEVIKISQPIKSYWAQEKNLDLCELLSDSEYKEQYRLDMIEWSEEKRQKDYGCFCRAACESAADRPVWIVSDIRRKTDVQWFKESYGNIVKKIRLETDENTRIERGFQFKNGIDDAASECDLDDYTEWDLIIENNSNKSIESLTSNIMPLIEFLNNKKSIT